MKYNYLMCKPDFYDVDYVINPWMEGNIHKSSLENAKLQWENLFNELSKYLNVDLISPQKGLPDIVFTANGTLVYQEKAV